MGAILRLPYPKNIQSDVPTYTHTSYRVGLAPPYFFHKTIKESTGVSNLQGPIPTTY